MYTNRKKAEYKSELFRIPHKQTASSFTSVKMTFMTIPNRTLSNGTIMPGIGEE